MNLILHSMGDRESNRDEKSTLEKAHLLDYMDDLFQCPSRSLHPVGANGLACLS